MQSRSPCPTLPDYQQLLLGLLPEREAERVEEHVLHCPACVQTVQEVLAGDTLVEALRAQPAVAEKPEQDVIDGLIRQLLLRGASPESSATTASAAEAS